MKITVVGIGKLGAPLAAVLASKGNDVVGVDVNSEAVRLMSAGRAPVDEPGLQELISASGERLDATTDFTAAADSDVIILLVPTPSDERGGFTNAFLLAAVEAIGPSLQARDDYQVVVVTSTVMPGSCNSTVWPALERATGRRVGGSLGLCYSPEFIALGNVIRDMLVPDMVLIGESDPRAGAVLERLYAGVCENDPPFRHMNLVNAELTKIAVNTYVTMKISYANTLADVCDRLPGANVDAVTDALGLDSRIGPKYIRGALAYGGPCFPRDNKAFAVLARDIGADPALAEATDAINVAQADRLARSRPVTAEKREHSRGPRALLQAAHKCDRREPGHRAGTPSGARGVPGKCLRPSSARCRTADPPGERNGCTSVADVLGQSDVMVISTPWPEFADLPLTAVDAARGRLVAIDCWGILSEERYGETFDIVRLGRALDERVQV